MKIAVDAMGGDYGPAVVVEGAAAASREFGAAVVLVGDKAAIEREVLRLGAGGLPLEIRHASQVVGMGESPSQALRRKRDSSLRVAAQLVRDREAEAFVSAGNTGAAMAIAMFVIGVLPGVDRPAIAAVLLLTTQASAGPGPSVSIGRTTVRSRSSTLGLARRLCTHIGCCGAPPCEPTST